MSSNETIDRPTIEPADFQKPRRLKLTLFRMLNRWFAETTSRVTESWMTVCTHPVQLSMQSIEIVSDDNARKMLPGDGYAAAFRLGEGPETGYLCLTGAQTWMFLADLLNLSSDGLPRQRQPTQTELSMLEILVEMYASALGTAWPGEGDLPCQFNGFIEKPNRKRLLAPQSAWLKGTQTVTSRFGATELFWLFPQGPIENWIEESVEFTTAHAGGPAGDLILLTERIPVAISVQLGELPLTMTEISQLAVGDVLVLEQNIHAPLTAAIEGHPKWKGRPVQRGSHLALQLTENSDSILDPNHLTPK